MTMQSAALSNNLNELDLLLQDLSAARYSEQAEEKTQTFTSHSQNDSVEPPQPPERTKGGIGKFVEQSSSPLMELHAVERSRTEKSSHIVSDNGNDESKWEYMGFGIWENRDGSAEPPGPQYTGYRDSPTRSQERNITSLDAGGTGFSSSKYVYEEKTVIKERSNGYTPGGYSDRSISNGYTGTTNGINSSTNGYTVDGGYNGTASNNGYNNGYSNGYQTDSRKSAERKESVQERTINIQGRSDRTSGYQVDTEAAGASNATHELDELMTSLNNFKMTDRQVDEPVIPPNLDTMLGNLQEDMDKQGVKTTQKGVCGACMKPIVGQVITALGYTWHPEHFTCAHCNQELGTSNFFERDGKPYCEQDYHYLFSPRCGYCQGPILDKCISALDTTWHPEHFLCSGCGKQLGEEGFHEREDSAYCKSCYFDQFAPRCGGCSTPITENYVSSLNQQWHPNCFVCKECQCTFQDGNFFEHEGSPYCETHYHALRGSLCAGCHKAISGRCITAMFRKFHPEHFVCSFCLKQLNKGTFKEQGDKPYCHECFDRLFG